MWNPAPLMTPEEQLARERLFKAGYRRVSNKYRIVSRIDCPDWLDRMAAYMRRSIAEFYITGTDVKGRLVVGSQPTAMWEDHYRRVYSKDVLEGIVPAIFRSLPLSGDDCTGYLEKPE